MSKEKEKEKGKEKEKIHGYCGTCKYGKALGEGVCKHPKRKKSKENKWIHHHTPKCGLFVERPTTVEPDLPKTCGPCIYCEDQIGGPCKDPKLEPGDVKYVTLGTLRCDQFVERPEEFCGSCRYGTEVGEAICRHPELCKKQMLVHDHRPKCSLYAKIPDIPHEEIDQTPLTIQELIPEFRKHIYIAEDTNISIPLSFGLTNHSPSDPDAMGIIAPSGSAKTEVVRSYGDTENQYIMPISSLTSKTFVSGYKDAHDLAPQLRGRMIVIKDFTSILSKNKDEISGIFSDVREILDGYITKNFGGDVGKKEFRNIHSSILFACTNAIENYYSLYSVLGQRIIFFRPASDPRKARKKAMENAGGEKGIRQKHHALTMRLMNTALVQNKERIEKLTKTVPMDMQERIGRLCEFLAIARTHIARDYKGDMASLPEPELPTRLTKTFCKIVDAHSILYGRMPTFEDEAVAIRLMHDNIPTERATVLSALCSLKGPYKTSQIAIAARNIPTSMCNRVLNDLAALGIVRRYDRATYETNADEWEIIEDPKDDEKQFKTCFSLIENYSIWSAVSEAMRGELLCGVGMDCNDETLKHVLNDFIYNDKGLTVIENKEKRRQIIECMMRFLAYTLHNEPHPSSVQEAAAESGNPIFPKNQKQANPVTQLDTNPVTHLINPVTHLISSVTQMDIQKSKELNYVVSDQKTDESGNGDIDNLVTKFIQTVEKNATMWEDGHGPINSSNKMDFSFYYGKHCPLTIGENGNSKTFEISEVLKIVEKIRNITPGVEGTHP